MFNFFKNSEEKLKKDMKRKIGNMALVLFKNNPLKGTPMEGIALIDCIGEAKEFYLIRSIAISKDYNVDREKTIKIINECAKEIYDDFIE